MGLSPETRRRAAEGQPARIGAGRRRRGELLIASGRLVLAAFSLLAIDLQARHAGRFVEPLDGTLEAYFVYAMVVALVVWRRWAPPAWLGFATHAFDLVFFSLLSAWSLGPASPFFVFFVFAIVSATIRWQWRGTLWTAVAAMAAYGGLAVYSLEVLGPHRFALDIFAVRFVHLGVLAVLLAYLGSHQHGLLTELVRLRDWPRVVSEDRERALEATLSRVAAAFKVERVDLLWQESDEPRTGLARWLGGGVSLRSLAPREEPSWQERLLAEGRDLLLAHQRSGVVAVSETGGKTRWADELPAGAAPGDPVWSSALCLALRGQSARGVLVAYDRPHASPDDLVAGRLIAGIVASQLDQLALLASQRQIAADRERMQLARDLHDGLSQSLAGAALQLEAVARALDGEPPGARQRIERVQDLLEEEQRELRHFLHSSCAARPGEIGTTCLEKVLAKTRATWPLEIEAHGDLSLAADRPARWRAQVCRLVQEALANAARHSGAGRAELVVERRPGEVLIRVSDDGRGFAFEGCRDLAALDAHGDGPRSLCERVRGLEGSLTVESRRSGATLEIHLPTEIEEA